jgi:hypothetical protein
VVSGSIIPGVIVLTAQNLIAMFLVPSAAQAEDSTTEDSTTEGSTTEQPTRPTPKPRRQPSRARTRAPQPR